jgi:hypothetical protein
VKIHRILAITALVFAGAVCLRAQPVNVQQFQNIQQAPQFQTHQPGSLSTTNAPELFSGEDADTGPQRILRLAPRPDYFDVFLDSQVFYSDNANFVQGAAVIGSAVFVNTVQTAYTPPDVKWGSGRFAPTAGFVSQWYNYGNHRMAKYDFDAQTVFVGGRYTLDDWQFGLGGNYTRLLSQPGYSQTYSEWLPALTVQRIFPVNDRLLLVLNNQLAYHFSSVPSTLGTYTEINNRLDEAISLTVSWQIMSRLNLQPYVRFQYSNYRHNTLQNSDRNDYLSSCGVTLAWYFNKQVSLRTFFNYNVKQTNDPFTPAYHEDNGGVGVNLNLTF